MPRSFRIAIPTLIGGAFIALGYLRDFLFVNINYTLDTMHKGDPAYAHSFFAFLIEYGPSQLVKLKYLFTGVFTLLNLGLALAGIYWFFGKRKYLRWTILTYILLTAIAGAFFLGGKAFGFEGNGYRVALELMHALQSPVVAVVLGFGFFLEQRGRAEP